MYYRVTFETDRYEYYDVVVRSDGIIPAIRRAIDDNRNYGDIVVKAEEIIKPKNTRNREVNNDETIRSK